MSEEIDKLYSYSIGLMDRVEEIRITDENEVFVGLIERAANLGNIATLYYEDLSKDELDRVSSVLKLSYKMMDNEPSQEETITLESIVLSLEVLFREKKLLLGDSSKKQAA